MKTLYTLIMVIFISCFGYCEKASVQAEDGSWITVVNITFKLMEDYITIDNTADFKFSDYNNVDEASASLLDYIVTLMEDANYIIFTIQKGPRSQDMYKYIKDLFTPRGDFCNEWLEENANLTYDEWDKENEMAEIEEGKEDFYLLFKDATDKELKEFNMSDEAIKEFREMVRIRNNK